VRARVRLSSLLVLLACASGPDPAFARPLDLPVRDAAHPDAPLPAYRPDRLVVRLRSDAAPIARARAGGRNAAALGLPGVDAVAAAWGARFAPAFPGEPEPAPGARDLGAWWVVDLGRSADLPRALDAFAAAPEVALAEPVAVCPVDAMPDDSLWTRQWYLHQPATRRDVHAVEAWETTRGDPEIPIAVLDTGILPYHPDLGGTVAGGWGNLWTNAAERDGLDGVDDDANGFVDDVWGWDFVEADSAQAAPGEDWRDQDPDPNDFAGHGTAVASVIGALTDNRAGIAGALWDTRVMAVRVGSATRTYPLGEVEMVAAARGLRYATRAGARVVNVSFASGANALLGEAVLDAIEAGVTIVVSAGNNGTPNYLGLFEAVITVAATDSNDLVPLFSNRGPYVDLAAPGVDLTVAIVRRAGTDSVGLRQPGYTPGAAGTSFAAPLVAAGAAMIQAQRRLLGLVPLTPLGVRRRLLDGCEDISALNPGQPIGAGRLDLSRSLAGQAGLFAIPLAAPAIGPPVVQRTVRGRARLLVPLADDQLAALDPAAGATLRTVALPAPAAGALAAAALGPERGDGLFVPLADGRIAGIDASSLGALPGWPVQATPLAANAEAPLALGDLDGDRVIEVVWGGDDGNVYAWRADGAPLAGFPRSAGATGENLWIALADLDGAPGCEIVAASRGGEVHALRADGAEAPGWPVSADLPSVAPVVGRDSRGAPLVLVGSSGELRTFGAGGEPRGLIALPAPLAGALAVGSPGGGATDAFVIPMRGWLAVLNEILFVPPGTTWPAQTGGDPTGSPLVAPMLAGGTVAIALPVGLGNGGSRFQVFDFAGTPLVSVDLGQPAGPTMIADLDDDAATEVCTTVPGEPALYVADLDPGTWRLDRAAWPTARGNAARTGARFGAPGLGQADDAPPVAVTDLQAIGVEPHRVTLRWTAPRDTGLTGRAQRFDLRVAPLPLSENWFALADTVPGVPAPDSAGSEQRAVVEGLEENTPYGLALRSVDPGGNRSAPSNLLTVTTTGAPPGIVRDLRASPAGDTTVALRWTAVGDDGSTGRPARYRVRAAREPILDDADFASAPRGWTFDAGAPAGGPEARAAGGLAPGERWWFALRVEDDAGNLSPLSNVVEIVVGPLAGRAGVALAASRSPARAPVEIHWQAAAEQAGTTHRLRIHDLQGRVVRSLTVGPGESGIARWDGSDHAGQSVPAGLYFARLESGTRHATARLVLWR
jgi:chitodextrinase